MKKYIELSISLVLVGMCSHAIAHVDDKEWGNKSINTSFMPLNPSITYGPADSTADYPIAPSGESYLPITDERFGLHAQNHDYFPIVNAVIPPLFNPPVLDSIDKYKITPDEMVVINPGGEEIIHVMEGKRHGFNNMSISITNTLPGNGAPLHTHVGEEAHVVLKGTMRYFMKGEIFIVKAPYIVHIPPMTPHAFQNIDTNIVNIIGVFGSNQWEYDVLAAQPFPDNVNSNAGSCKINVINEWSMGGQLEVSITNPTPQVITGWSVNWLFTDGSTRVKKVWNADLSGKNPYIASNLSWNKKIHQNQTIKFQMLVSKADPSKSIQLPLLSGELCNN